MSACTDPELGAMLHAWELGMLSDVDRERFELHLLQCGHCADEVAQFRSVINLLNRDPAFRPESVPSSEVLAPTAIPLWRRRLTRVLLAAAAVTALAIPAYRMFFVPKNVTSSVQRLDLVPVRGDGDHAIRASRGGTIDIRFYVDTAGVGTNIRLLITSGHHVVFAADTFRDLTASGTGHLVLPDSLFHTGMYMLQIFPVSDSAVSPVQSYHFRVE